MKEGEAKVKRTSKSAKKQRWVNGVLETLIQDHFSLPSSNRNHRVSGLAVITLCLSFFFFKKDEVSLGFGMQGCHEIR